MLIDGDELECVFSTTYREVLVDNWLSFGNKLDHLCLSLRNLFGQPIRICRIVKNPDLDATA
jgi:hypothetical protein